VADFLSGLGGKLVDSAISGALRGIGLGNNTSTGMNGNSSVLSSQETTEENYKSFAQAIQTIQSFNWNKAYDFKVEINPVGEVMKKTMAWGSGESKTMNQLVDISLQSANAPQLSTSIDTLNLMTPLPTKAFSYNIPEECTMSINWRDSNNMYLYKKFVAGYQSSFFLYPEQSRFKITLYTIDEKLNTIQLFTTDKAYLQSVSQLDFNVETREIISFTTEFRMNMPSFTAAVEESLNSLYNGTTSASTSFLNGLSGSMAKVASSWVSGGGGSGGGLGGIVSSIGSKIGSIFG